MSYLVLRLAMIMLLCCPERGGTALIGLWWSELCPTRQYSPARTCSQELLSLLAPALYCRIFAASIISSPPLSFIFGQLGISQWTTELDLSSSSSPSAGLSSSTESKYFCHILPPFHLFLQFYASITSSMCFFHPSHSCTCSF